MLDRVKSVSVNLRNEKITVSLVRTNSKVVLRGCMHMREKQVLTSVK